MIGINAIGTLRGACGVYPVETGGEWRAPGKHEPAVIKRRAWYFNEARSELERSGLAVFRPKPRTKTLWLIEPTDAGVEYMRRLIEEQKPPQPRSV